MCVAEEQAERAAAAAQAAADAQKAAAAATAATTAPPTLDIFGDSGNGRMRRKRSLSDLLGGSKAAAAVPVPSMLPLSASNDDLHRMLSAPQAVKKAQVLDLADVEKQNKLRKLPVPLLRRLNTANDNSTNGTVAYDPNNYLTWGMNSSELLSYQLELMRNRTRDRAAA